MIGYTIYNREKGDDGKSTCRARQRESDKVRADASGGMGTWPLSRVGEPKGEPAPCERALSAAAEKLLCP